MAVEESADEDRKVRALMVQADDGYMNDHIAATFHLVHYCRLVHDESPKAGAIVARALRDQKADGSWLLNPPARDRHAISRCWHTPISMGGSSSMSVIGE